MPTLPNPLAGMTSAHLYELYWLKRDEERRADEARIAGLIRNEALYAGWWDAEERRLEAQADPETCALLDER